MSATDPMLLKDVSASETPLRTTFRIRVNGQSVSIGTVGQSPALMGVRLVSRKLGNIPSRVCIAQHCRTPGSSRPETFFYQS